MWPVKKTQIFPLCSASVGLTKLSMWLETIKDTRRKKKSVKRKRLLVSPGRFWNDLDLEDLRPLLSGDEEAVLFSIVGNAVQD